MQPSADALNIVLDDRTIFGTVTLDGDRIGRVESMGDGAREGADYLLPGLIDIHTDNIEHHFMPRPGVKWPATLAAVLAHDWQMLGAGVTTVLDSLSIGDYDSRGLRTAMLDAAIGGLTEARTAGLLKADHYFHFRCELSDPALLGIVERHVDNPGLRLMSLMDHTPGQRQWHDMALYREYRRKKNARVWSDEEFALYLAERRAHQQLHVPPSRAVISRAALERGISLASHDDTTLDDVETAHADGIVISEFPTTLAAAERARALGMQVVMGSPNIVLGGSHSGNASATDLADAGLLDILTSDYVPASLLHAPFILAARGRPLHDTIAMVSAKPADAIGLPDRGRIAPGLRADLLRVTLVGGVPVIRGIWVAGRRYL
ncbi:alpha-D-ribose 1-methylphosphonate 5-triphosphate diphosphatase [Kaistia dalseonensis]|uniref:Alpha-D-ribose 1-methylphosphonate 5-triphosphate diphosphatase n=1 Tax=Kaistia dalseonensis TaxID=410840 RepID=A0ABU0H476_9HYPH|nr:alpha-D-ribose 1-methylphosphonate 5-triphosphate diphosphatase [Kaistia dalseonensis]MCX5494527.1 alpha-D-ribose 1-methylphosphonate 5-triphosphate diphosphatase [Kaistia dalseonensis]MDQ0437106.1 alpha-D-ribose 1-methylphosphonate 5-triphosphate diphosphatase [Kaistia dalseonensis]